MFAVPGWKVRADSLVTEGAARPGESKDAPPHVHADRVARLSSKKRKRDLPEEKAKITSKDLESLWSKHVEGLVGKTKDGQRVGLREKKAKVRDVRSDAVAATGGRAVEAAEVAANGGLSHKSPRSKHEKKQRPDTVQSKDNRTPPRAPEKTQRAIKPLPKPSQHQDTKRTIEEENQKPAPNASTANPAPYSLAPPQPPPPPPTTQLTPLQAKMRDKLTSARFRHLNQTLYTTTSSSALQLFSHSPDLFAEYHAGFSQQVKASWPQNPVELYIRAIKARGPTDAHHPLPRRKTGRCTIADLGCGDAPLARGCQVQVKALGLKFHNFDLHAANAFVTKADIAAVPLRDGEVDVAVFCLSLMGTNWVSFVEEAWRLLRGDGKGEVWVAEVKSRFGRVRAKVVENSVGKKRKGKEKKTAKLDGDEDEKVNGEELFADAQEDAPPPDETDLSAFIKVFQRRGFVLREGSVDKANKMFCSMVFAKYGVPAAGKHKGKRWNGREYEQGGVKHSGKMKFLEGQEVDGDDGDVLEDEEAKALKPCVYKKR